MEKKIDEIRARIRVLQEELEAEYLKSIEAIEEKRAHLAEEFLQQQKRYKTGLIRFLIKTHPLTMLSAPVIYLGWIPFFLLDLFVSLYQTICFPVYRIPKVRRADYLIFGREDLPYLNLIEKFNCLYCSYANGAVAYAREVAARTEQYWCPIKYARRIRAAHDRYPEFFDYGDAEAYQRGLDRLRQSFEDEKETAPSEK